MKFGLHNIQTLVQFLENPHKKYPTIHIAGTNGKGSTSSMLASILTAAGYKVGLYTSPHLLQFNERIRINGKPISDKKIVHYTKLLQPIIQKIHATFFEATTAMAFQYFADEKIDIAVIETGLGGRLDSTNIITPKISIITSIAKDHKEQLGNTYKSIATEKGGIIKKNIPCVIGLMNKQSKQTLIAIVKEKKSQIIDAEKETTLKSQKIISNGQKISITTSEQNYNLVVDIVGKYQQKNIRTVLCVVEELQKQGMKISFKDIEKGFANIKKYSGLRGRFEIIQKNPTIIIDVGHNVEGIENAMEALSQMNYNKLHCIFGVMEDKEYKEMVKKIISYKPIMYLVQPNNPRALSLEKLERVFIKFSYSVKKFLSVKEAILQAKSEIKKDDILLIIGSHFVASEAMECF